MEKINSTSFLRMALFGLAFLFSLAFYSPTFGQCTNGSGFGAVTAPSTPTPIQITSCSYAGEYATVTSCPAGASFKFNTSNPNDFLTIRQGTSGGAVLGTGTGEVTVTTSVVGNLYMHINTDPSCGTQSSCRSSWVECVSCQAPPPGECLNSISYSSISAPNSPTPVTITTCAYAAEYEWITGAVAGETYTFASSLNDWLTIRQGTPGGTVLGTGTGSVTVTCTVSGNIYVHINTDETCSSAYTGLCRTITVSCNSCTPPPPGACTNTSSYGSANAPTTGVPYVSTYCNYASEYFTVNNATAGATYEIQANGGTANWLTIRQGTPGGTVLATGFSPVTVTPTVSGSFYIHINKDGNCGTESSCRYVTITCTSCGAPPPVDCLNSSAFGSVSAPTTPSPVNISSCNFAGDYATVNNAVAGQTYQFSATGGAGNFLTIRQGTPGGEILAAGPSPVEATVTVSGSVYVHLNTNASCGTDFSCHTTTVTNLCVDGYNFWYADNDGDGFGDPATGVQTCIQPAGYVDNDLDCDDSDAEIHPDAEEICNGIDDNCDGQIDEGLLNIYFADADGDGFGDPESTIEACSEPAGYVDNPIDCDDTNAEVYPGAEEVCNGIDDNCNGEIDEGVTNTYFVDNDGDGYGDPAAPTVEACDEPAGYADNDFDCDDNDPEVNPGVEEVCYNFIDDNCDGEIDEFCPPCPIEASLPDCATVYVGYGPAARVTLTPTVTGAIGDATYTWSNGATTPSISVSPTTTTVYSVVVKDEEGCMAEASITVEAIDVRCNDVGVVMLWMCNNGNDICVPLRLVPYYFSVGATLGVCGTSDTACDPYEPFGSGGSSNNLLGAGNSDLGEFPYGGQQIEIFPNPATDKVNVVFSQPFETGVVKLFDLQGKMVSFQKLDANTMALELPVSNLIPGAYILNAVVDSGQFTQKIVIE